MSRWTTKSGEILNISDMSTSHIKNCINILEKLEDSCDYELLDPFLTGLRCESLIDAKFETSQKINQFNEELLKRNINLNK